MKKHHNPLETKYGPNPDENLQEVDRLNNEAIRKRFAEETPSPIPSVEEAAEHAFPKLKDAEKNSMEEDYNRVVGLQQKAFITGAN